MDDLIARLKKTTGQDWKLDQEIFALAEGWSYPLVGAAQQQFECATLAHGRTNYTASIDAALTLVPKGLYWMAGFGKCREDEPLGGVAIFRPGNEDIPEAQAEAATVALAICIAALTARQSLNNS